MNCDRVKCCREWFVFAYAANCCVCMCDIANCIGVSFLFDFKFVFNTIENPVIVVCAFDESEKRAKIRAI